jgi:hypothetical protein
MGTIPFLQRNPVAVRAIVTPRPSAPKSDPRLKPIPHGCLNTAELDKLGKPV